MLPSNFRFQKWIKGNKPKTYNRDLIALLSGYFECSCKQAEDYLGVLSKKELKLLLNHIGLQESDIKKLLKK
jgi:hypothetical protein